MPKRLLLAGEKPLLSARGKILDLQISEASFTAFTRVLAVVYNEAEAYALQRLQRKEDRLLEIHDGLVVNAKVVKAAEEMSTIGG